jgi:hypothetical protein
MSENTELARAPRPVFVGTLRLKPPPAAEPEMVAVRHRRHPRQRSHRRNRASCSASRTWRYAANDSRRCSILIVHRRWRSASTDSLPRSSAPTVRSFSSLDGPAARLILRPSRPAVFATIWTERRPARSRRNTAPSPASAAPAAVAWAGGTGGGRGLPRRSSRAAGGLSGGRGGACVVTAEEAADAWLRFLLRTGPRVDSSDTALDRGRVGERRRRR